MDCIDLSRKPPLPCRLTPATWSWTLPAVKNDMDEELQNNDR